MQKFIVGAVGFAFWLVAIGLTVELVRENTEGQSAVAIGVAGLAIGMSGLGLLLARHAWTQRAYPEIAAGVAMWMAGVVCLGFIEISYWVSSYTERYDHYSQERTARQRLESLNDRDWKALTTGQVPASSAQLAAAIEAKKLDPAVARSGGCAAITRVDSREPCRQFFELQSQLAAAKTRETLEARIKVDTPDTQAKRVSANVFAAAEFAANMRGGDVKDWAYIIIFWSWLLVTLVRDAGLLVMNPLGRRTASETPAAILPSEKAGQAVQPRPRQPMVALERISGVNLAVTASNSADTLACEPNLAQAPALPTEVIRDASKNSPAPEGNIQKTNNAPADPTDGGTPVDVRPVEHSEMSVSPNVVKTDGTPYQHPKHSLKNLRGNVRVWKDERLERTALAGGGATTGALHDDYTRWCALRGHVALHKGPFGKALNKLGMKRVGKVAGSFRPGWVLKTEIAVKSRKAA